MCKKVVSCVLVALFALLSASSAKGDLLRGDVVLNTTATIWNEGSSQGVYVTPMIVDNLSTGQTIMAFCGDFTVSTSPAFNSSTGEVYGAHGLLSPTLTLYSDLQKQLVNDLFSYAYASAFDLSGNVIDAVNAQAIQLVVWEILMETGTAWSITSGSFYATNLASGVAATADSWLDVLSGGVSTWDSLGLTPVLDYDMTVYVADGGSHASQTLISITGPTPVVPEPATMLIFGIGAAAIPYLRRKKQTSV